MSPYIPEKGGSMTFYRDDTDLTVHAQGYHHHGHHHHHDHHHHDHDHGHHHGHHHRHKPRGQNHLAVLKKALERLQERERKVRDRFKNDR